jgi:hypothetical protein
VSGAANLIHDMFSRFGLTKETFQAASMAAYERSKSVGELKAILECPENFLRALVAARALDGDVDPSWVNEPKAFIAGGMAAEEMRRRHGIISSRLRSADPGDVGLLMTEWGQFLWQYTYKAMPGDDASASIVATAAMREMSEWFGAGELTDHQARLLQIVLTSGARWVDGAMRTLTTTPTYFAAMACTTISETAFEDIRIPWPVFMVKVPPGQLVDGDKDYDRIAFALLRNVKCLNGVFDICHMHVFTSKAPHDSMESWMCCGADDAVRTVLFREFPSSGLSSVEERIQQSAKRAVVGLLYTLQHTNHWRERVERSAAHRNIRENPPPHRIIFVGRDMTVKATPALRQFIRHGDGHGSPSVQTLVRGHTKRQICGPGGSLRKIIWVEPYWRGPEEAPILVRPYRVGGATA